VVFPHAVHVSGVDELGPALAVFRLFPGVAELLDELPVDERDRGVLLEDHRRRARGLEERPVPGLGLLQARLGPLLLRDVHGVAEDGRLTVQRDGGHRFEDPADAALAGDDPELVGRGPLAAEHGPGIFFDGLAVLGINHEARFPADELPGRVARVGGGVGVDEAEPAVLDDVDSGDGLLRQGPEEVLAFLQRVRGTALPPPAFGDHGGGAEAHPG